MKLATPLSIKVLIYLILWLKKDLSNRFLNMFTDELLMTNWGNSFTLNEKKFLVTTVSIRASFTYYFALRFSCDKRKSIQDIIKVIKNFLNLYQANNCHAFYSVFKLRRNENSCSNYLHKSTALFDFKQAARLWDLLNRWTNWFIKTAFDSIKLLG